MIQIQSNKQTQYVVLTLNETPMLGLDITDQRYLAVWLCQNRPEMIREIVCEECPEHTGVVKK